MKIELILSLIYVTICICLSRPDKNNSDNLKKEYIIELVSNDSVKIYSYSNDIVYSVLTEDIIKTLEIDNK